MAVLYGTQSDGSLIPVQADNQGRLVAELAPTPLGKVLQVLQFQTSTEISVAVNTYTSTTLSGTITLSESSSQVLVLVNQAYAAYRAATAVGVGVRVLRDSTVICSPWQNTNGPASLFLSSVDLTSASIYGEHSISYVDSPGIQGPVTYSTEGRPFNAGSGGYVDFQPAANIVTPKSRLILMEIGA